MKENQEQTQIANLTEDELEKLEQMEQNFGYALVAYENERDFVKNEGASQL